MTDEPRYYEMQRRGELIQFTAETLPSGCTFFSVQKFHEAWERRHHPELFVPLFTDKRRRKET